VGDPSALCSTNGVQNVPWKRSGVRSTALATRSLVRQASAVLAPLSRLCRQGEDLHVDARLVYESQAHIAEVLRARAPKISVVEGAGGVDGTRGDGPGIPHVAGRMRRSQDEADRRRGAFPTRSRAERAPDKAAKNSKRASERNWWQSLSGPRIEPVRACLRPFSTPAKSRLRLTTGPSGAPASSLNLSIAGALATCLNRGAA
jgi:hypothetical protein